MGLVNCIYDGTFQNELSRYEELKRQASLMQSLGSPQNYQNALNTLPPPAPAFPSTLLLIED